MKKQKIEMYQMKLENKVAIVTGSGQGIGKGIVSELAKEGAKVVVSDINQENIDKTVNEINSFGEAIGVKADVSNSEEVSQLVNVTVKKFGRVDILVNNAGIYPFKLLTEMEEEDWDKVLNVNLKGVFNCTKAVLPEMSKQKSGNIVNIASIAGAVIGYPNLVHYSASKGGVLGFTRSAAIDLAQYKIRVNAIAPGGVETPGTEGTMDNETSKQFIQMIPLKRMGQPIDIAKAVVFLASDDSSYITGQMIIVDGGLTLQ
jgi:3-oxoacyl-[acyl-carrier protein] reductase